MKYPSMGWSNLTRRERGQHSERYNELAAQYTKTSQRVGDIRNELIELTTGKIWPPITRRDVMIHSSSRPQIEALGAAAVELLALQDAATAENLDAMLALRAEDTDIYESLRPVVQAEISAKVSDTNVHAAQRVYTDRAMTI